MTRTINIKTYLRFGLLGLLFAFIGVYSIFQVNALAKGVNLEVKGIEDGETLQTGVVELAGLAEHASVLTVNGKEVSIDKESNFKSELVLSPGYNIISIEAEDKFKKKTEIVYRVFYKQESQVGMSDAVLSTNQ